VRNSRDSINIKGENLQLAHAGTRKGVQGQVEVDVDVVDIKQEDVDQVRNMLIVFQCIDYMTNIIISLYYSPPPSSGVSVCLCACGESIITPMLCFFSPLIE